MSENLHERASEIIAKALDMEADEADSYIEYQCGENSELLRLTKELYHEV
jgi:hypothetical protein